MVFPVWCRENGYYSEILRKKSRKVAGKKSENPIMLGTEKVFLYDRANECQTEIKYIG